MNNRPTMLMILLFFQLFVTLVVGSIDLSTTSSVTQGYGEFALSLGGMFSVIGYWFNMMTFQVEGIPSLIVMLVFYPINLAILVIIVEMIRGN